MLIMYSWGWVHVFTGRLSGESKVFILPDRSARGIFLYYENCFALEFGLVKNLLLMECYFDACISAELTPSLEQTYLQV